MSQLDSPQLHHILGFAGAIGPSVDTVQAVRGGYRGSDPGQGPDGDDPFAHLDLDEAFVRAAPIHEPTAQERHRRVSASQRKAEKRVARQARRRSRKRYARFWSVLLLVAMAAGAWFWTANWSDGEESANQWTTSTDTFVHESTVSMFPPPPEESSDVPLGTPLDLQVPSSNFAFTMLQPNGTDPVAYDPCRPVRVVVNSRTAPPEGQEMIDAGVAEISRVTGLEFMVEGATDEPPSDPRAPLQEERYGNRWAPVLIAWSDPDETDLLGGPVAGVAGSQAISKGSDELVYVTGTVVLDGPQFEELLRHPDGRATAEGVVLHELGHLVGLDHIDAAGELMQPAGRPEVTDFGPGDLTGLAELGRGVCRPDL